MTKIEIFDLSDTFGLTYDTFTFDFAAVPIPAGGLLLLSGFGVLGFAWLFSRVLGRTSPMFDTF